MSLKNTSSYAPFRAARTDPTERPLQFQSLGEELSTSGKSTEGKIPSAAEILPLTAHRNCTARAARQKEQWTQMGSSSILKAEQNKYRWAELGKFQRKYLHRVTSFWKQDPLESRMTPKIWILFLLRCSTYYFWLIMQLWTGFFSKLLY